MALFLQKKSIVCMLFFPQDSKNFVLKMFVSPKFWSCQMYIYAVQLNYWTKFWSHTLHLYSSIWTKKTVFSCNGCLHLYSALIISPNVSVLTHLFTLFCTRTPTAANYGAGSAIVRIWGFNVLLMKAPTWEEEKPEINPQTLWLVPYHNMTDIKKHTLLNTFF